MKLLQKPKQLKAGDRISAILCMIGGDDSIRMLPYIEFPLMAQHPKILSGYLR